MLPAAVCITLLQLPCHPDYISSCFHNLPEHRLCCKPCVHKNIVHLDTGSEVIADEPYGNVCFVRLALFTELIPVCPAVNGIRDFIITVAFEC